MRCLLGASGGRSGTPGPSVVTVRNGLVYDIIASVPTTVDLSERGDSLEVVCGAPGEALCPVDELLAASLSDAPAYPARTSRCWPGGGATGALGGGYPVGIGTIVDAYLSGDVETAVAQYQAWVPRINHETVNAASRSARF